MRKIKEISCHVFFLTFYVIFHAQFYLIFHNKFYLNFCRGAFNKKPNSNGLSAPRELAFQIPTHVLRHTMNGQDWADGDELYHNWLTCPTLLLYGDKDKLVALDEEHEMLRVSEREQ